MADQSVTRSGKGGIKASGRGKSIKNASGLGTSYRGGYGMAGYIGGPYGEWAGRSGSPVNRRSTPPASEIDIRGYFGDERTGIRKTVPTAPKQQQVVSNVVRERTTPAPASKTTTQPARMAVNRATGKTTGFTSGTTTGKTMTKAGTAYKTAESAYQRQQRMAAEKIGGSMRPTSGGASSRSTGGGSRSSGGGGAVGSSSGTRGYGSGGNTGRGDVGAGRRGGGR